MYNEENQEEMCNAVKKVLPMGRMLVGKSVIKNVILTTDNDGEFWYGDIDTSVDTKHITTVATQFNKTIRVTQREGNLNVEFKPN